jgi:hypothetical protein
LHSRHAEGGVIMMVNEEALFTVVTEDDTYLFETQEQFNDFMSDNNSLLTINRIEKDES